MTPEEKIIDDLAGILYKLSDCDDDVTWLDSNKFHEAAKEIKAALSTIHPATKYEQLASDHIAKEVLNELKELNKKSEPVIGDIISILKAEKERAANDMRVHGENKMERMYLMASERHLFINRLLQKISGQPVSGGVEPKKVCYCGSLRVALDAFKKAEYEAVLKGEIALLPCCMFVDIEREYGAESDYKQKADDLHKRKIDISDEVFVLNVGGYIGQSTRSEIDYAVSIGKPVKYLEPLSQRPH